MDASGIMLIVALLQESHQLAFRDQLTGLPGRRALEERLRSVGSRYIVAMDADLQNDPADIPLLLAKLEEGFDVVSGWRKERKDGALTRIGDMHVINPRVGLSARLGSYSHEREQRLCRIAVIGSATPDGGRASSLWSGATATRRAAGEPQGAIARTYNVDQATISRLRA